MVSGARIEKSKMTIILIMALLHLIVCQSESASTAITTDVVPRNESSNTTVSISNTTTYTTAPHTVVSESTPNTPAFNCIEFRQKYSNATIAINDIEKLLCIFEYRSALIGFAAGLALMLIANILICVVRCYRKKSTSNTADGRSKGTDSVESKNEEPSSTQRSNEQLGNTNHHPPTYELVREPASPYAEVNDADETTTPGCVYSEVAMVRAAKSKSVMIGNMNPEEGASAARAVDTGTAFDDVTAISAEKELQIEAEKMNDENEINSAVDGTVVPLYSDPNKIKKTVMPDLKLASPFALNYANAIKSLGEKFKIPSRNLEADCGDNVYDDAAIVKTNDTQPNLETDSGEDVYDEAAIVKINYTKPNADTQDGVDNLYQEASAVKLERLTGARKSNEAPISKAKPLAVPHKRNYMKHGADLTLMDNNLYG